MPSRSALPRGSVDDAGARLASRPRWPRRRLRWSTITVGVGFDWAIIAVPSSPRVRSRRVEDFTRNLILHGGGRSLRGARSPSVLRQGSSRPLRRLKVSRAAHRLLAEDRASSAGAGSEVDEPSPARRTLQRDMRAAALHVKSRTLYRGAAGRQRGAHPLLLRRRACCAATGGEGRVRRLPGDVRGCSSPSTPTSPGSLEQPRPHPGALPRPRSPGSTSLHLYNDECSTRSGTASIIRVRTIRAQRRPGQRRGTARRALGHARRSVEFALEPQTILIGTPRSRASSFRAAGGPDSGRVERPDRARAGRLRDVGMPSASPHRVQGYLRRPRHLHHAAVSPDHRNLDSRAHPAGDGARRRRRDAERRALRAAWSRRRVIVPPGVTPAVSEARAMADIVSLPWFWPAVIVSVGRLSCSSRSRSATPRWPGASRAALIVLMVRTTCARRGAPGSSSASRAHGRTAGTWPKPSSRRSSGSPSSSSS